MPAKTLAKRIPPLISPRTIEGLSERYLTTPKTIRNWIARGYDVFDPESLAESLMQQRTPGRWMDLGGYKAEQRPVPAKPSGAVYTNERAVFLDLYGSIGEMLIGALILSGRELKNGTYYLPKPYGCEPGISDAEWDSLFETYEQEECIAAADKWWADRRERQHADNPRRKGAK